MQLPDHVRGLKWITVLWALTIGIWVMLEGDFRQTILLGLLSCIVLLGHLANRMLAGRTLALGVFLLLSALFGGLLGLGSALLTLFFMAIKTGLHAHGPEFNAQEIEWIFQQIPLWTLAGLLGGLGLGLLLKAVSSKT